MATGEGTTASEAGGSREPLAAQRARLAASSAARGLMWAVLTVSLLGTVVTAPYLPSPWGRPVVLLSIVGGLVSGLVRRDRACARPLGVTLGKTVSPEGA